MANQKPERQFNYLKILKDSKNALNWFIDYSAKLEFHDFGGTMSFDLITVFLGYFFPIHKDGLVFLPEEFVLEEDKESMNSAVDLSNHEEKDKIMFPNDKWGVLNTLLNKFYATSDIPKIFRTLDNMIINAPDLHFVLEE